MKKTGLIIALCVALHPLFAQDLLKVGVAGLTHDHVHVLLRAWKRSEVTILGIAESDKALISRYQRQYALPDSIFFPDLKAMLDTIKPDVVLAYNATAEHLGVAEVCLPRKMPVCVEKPLAVNSKQAKRMAELAAANHTYLLTNYETTWYGSVQQMKATLDAGHMGKIHKIMAKDGHQGPKEIGCSADFLNWLTDPIKNGGGALMDFGCYGATIMTWLLKGERPVAVTAVTRHLKPQIYPKVEDDATIVLEYADGTTGIIQGSWDWSYNIKDLQVYTDKGSLYAADGNTLLNYHSPVSSEAVLLENGYYKDHISYLKAVLKDKVNPGDDLSSLPNNLVVVSILEAASKSAQTGKRVLL